MSTTASTTTRLIVVDSQALFREGVSRVLEGHPGFRVMAQAGSVADALAALEKCGADVLLVGLSLVNESGYELLRSVRQRGFAVKVLVVAAHVDDTAALQLMRSGISGIFLKRNSTDMLIAAIERVAAGESWIDQQFLGLLVREATGRHLHKGGDFTHREHQVLNYVVEGLSNKAISDRLGVSESSVKGTLQQLFRKTGVRTRSRLVRFAFEHRSVSASG